MSPVRRSGAAVAAALAAIVATGILTGRPAAAALPVVKFAGSSLLGLPLLDCASQPDSPTLTLAPGKSVKLDNLTGHRAAIYVDGTPSDDTGPVSPNGTAVMTFPIGIWVVAMVPDSAGSDRGNGHRELALLVLIGIVVLSIVGVSARLWQRSRAGRPG